jgi:hypothetical protein
MSEAARRRDLIEIAYHEAGHAVAAVEARGTLESMWVEVTEEGVCGRTTQTRGSRPLGYPAQTAFITLAGPCAGALVRRKLGNPEPARIRGTDLEHLREKLAFVPQLDRRELERATFEWLTQPAVEAALHRVAGEVVRRFEPGVRRVELTGAEVVAIIRRRPCRAAA